MMNREYNEMLKFMIGDEVSNPTSDYLAAGFIPVSHKVWLIKKLFKGDPCFMYDLHCILDMADMSYQPIDEGLKHDPQNASIYIPELDLRIDTKEYYDKEDDEWLIESVTFS